MALVMAATGGSGDSPAFFHLMDGKAVFRRSEPLYDVSPYKWWGPTEKTIQGPFLCVSCQSVQSPAETGVARPRGKSTHDPVIVATLPESRGRSASPLVHEYNTWSYIFIFTTFI